jgi:hypothetical protein
MPRLYIDTLIVISGYTLILIQHVGDRQKENAPTLPIGNIGGRIGYEKTHLL